MSSERKNEPSKSQQKMLNFPPATTGLLSGLLFDSEEGGDVFLRNVGLSPEYTLLQLNCTLKFFIFFGDDALCDLKIWNSYLKL
jgi:hypothetical protein